MVEGLDSIEECRPKPAKHFIPQWFKDIPPSSNELMPTVRNCPSFTDYFSMGYILPMWSDFKLNYQEETNNWSWDGPTTEFKMTSHDNGQFIDYVQPTFNGVEGQFVFKAVSPWRIITPKGWSVLQLPLFYNFNKEFSVLPGVIDTDIHTHINQQILYHGNGKTIDIKRGTPLVLYVPFKRESSFLDFEIRYRNKKDKERFVKEDINIRTKFISGVYRKLQRERDKNG